MCWRFAYCCSFVMTFVPVGCTEVSRAGRSTWHEKCGWKAEDYFEDPQVIALCHAIEASDIAEIDRLVAAGADVNAQGKGRMTPLLWAYPDNKLERFKRLLENGADPNVIVESDFNTHGGISPGDSVTHLACESSFPGYFAAVFANGGDVNLVNSGKGKLDDTPIFLVLKYGGVDIEKKVELLIKQGANLNRLATGFTPPMQAVSRGHFGIALLLLEAGADCRIYQENEVQRLIHVVARQERRLGEFTPRQKSDYHTLIDWLEKRGESFEAAKADIERWDSWSQTDFRRKMDAEIAERKAREALEDEAGKGENEAEQ